MADNRERYEPCGTKISPEAAVLWNEICDSLETDTYHMLQWFIYTMIRASSRDHALSSDMQRLLTLMDADYVWQRHINLAAPSGKPDIAQIVAIVQEEGKQGAAATMIDKPYLPGRARQTECVDDIVERVLEVCMPGVARRLRSLAKKMKCRSVSALLITMAEEQAALLLAEEDYNEMRGTADYHDYGRRVEYGKRTKRTRHTSPNNYPTQSLFSDADFNDNDNNQRQTETNTIQT